MMVMCAASGRAGGRGKGLIAVDQSRRTLDDDEGVLAGLVTSIACRRQPIEAARKLAEIVRLDGLAEIGQFLVVDAIDHRRERNVVDGREQLGDIFEPLLELV